MPKHSREIGRGTTPGPDGSIHAFQSFTREYTTEVGRWPDAGTLGRCSVLLESQTLSPKLLSLTDHVRWKFAPDFAVPASGIPPD